MQLGDKRWPKGKEEIGIQDPEKEEELHQIFYSYTQDIE